MSNIDKLYKVCVELALRVRKEKGDDVLPPLAKIFNKMLANTDGEIDEKSLKVMEKALGKALNKKGQHSLQEG